MYFADKSLYSYKTRGLAVLPLFCPLNKTKPIICIETREKRSECHRVGHFGRVRCRTRTCALLCMKSRNNWLCMQENTSIHSMCPRARERSQAERGRTAVDATTASRCCGSTFAYPLVYTFSISNPRPNAVALGAKLRYTSGLPQYRRYVVANLRALAI